MTQKTNFSAIDSNHQNRIEQRVLSCLLIQPELLKVYSIDSDLFDFPYNKTLYECICNSIKNDCVDFEEKSFQDNPSMIEYAVKVQDAYTSSELLDDDIKTLENYNRINQAEGLMKQLKEGEVDFIEFSCQIDKLKESSIIISAAEKRTVDDIYNLISTPEQSLNFIYYPSLNHMQFKKSALHIVGARPSIGKSAMALNMMYDLSIQYHCVYVNMEMGEAEIYERLVSLSSGIPVNQLIQSDEIAKTDSRVPYKVKDAIRKLLSEHDYDIYSQSITLKGIERLIINQKRNNDKHIIIFLDRLETIRLTSKYSSEVDRLNQIIQNLHRMTMDYHVSIFLLSQINRQGTDEPTIENLKGSGAIEEYAHSVLLLWSPPQDNNVNTWQLVANIGKNRSNSGKGKKIDFDFIRDTQKIVEVE